MRIKKLQTKAEALLWLNDKTESIVSVKNGADEWLKIKFQDGPVSEVGWNGICMLDIIDAMVDRLQAFENKWPRHENNGAIGGLITAREWLVIKRENRKKERRNSPKKYKPIFVPGHSVEACFFLGKE